MASSLERLNDDVFMQIYELLLPKQGLRSLSLSCKSIRGSCMPVLFRSSWCRPQFLTWDEFISPPIWPYVHRLFISGPWEDLDLARAAPEHTPIPFADVFSRLHNISAVVFRHTSCWGVPRISLSSVLSFPGLRSLEVHGTLHFTSQWESSADIALPMGPLSSFQQVLENYRGQPRQSAGDMKLLCDFTEQSQLQQSLETLVIPSENAPLDNFAAHEWPRLKVLSLRGERQRVATLFISIFERMPALRELILETACSYNMGRVLFCPPGWTGPCPWPELRSLVVSYPNPEDPLYAFLPCTLRRLTLHCWPRHYVTLLPHESHYVADLGWDSPILSSSEMLQILSRCPPSDPEELELEFEEDERDLELFTLIPRVFPNLVKLTVLRYRKRGNPDVPVREIGKALAPLSRLIAIYLHLDFKVAPHPYAAYNETAVEEFGILRVTTQNAVDILAHELSSSVKTISSLHRRMSRNFWIPYDVTRTSGTVYASELDFRGEDEPGPPYFTHFYPPYYVDNDR